MPFNIPIQNRYEVLEEGDVQMEQKENEENYMCDICRSVLKTMKGLKNHKIYAHGQKKRGRDIESENTKLEGDSSELKKERKIHKKI